MFLLNSCLGLFSATSFEAPLLPKLRGHFAEFLNNTSLVDLRILSLSTCVGFRYGRKQIYSGFSWQLLPVLPYFRFGPSLPSPSWSFFSLHRSCTSTGLSFPGSHFVSASPQFCFFAVQESPPALHRLRFSASP